MTTPQAPTWTWEPVTAIGAGWLIGAVFALPGGQGAAAVLTGHQFPWPSVPTRAGTPPLASAVIGLATGTPGRGLTTAQQATLPGAAVIYLLIIIAEVLLAAAAIATLVWWHRSIGPGSLSGMASRRQAQDVLGPDRLREHAGVLRPDLPAHRSRRGRSTR